MKRGFTLVELSIVLVIIGLLIGGILVAQSMIQTVRIQKVIRNFQQYEVAITNFETSYKQFPGDSNMFRPPGDNDGYSLESSPGPTLCPGDNEFYNTFAHLSQAGMIAGNFIPYCDADTSIGYGSDANAGRVYPIISDSKLNYAGSRPGNKPIIMASLDLWPRTVRFTVLMNAVEFFALQEKFGFLPASQAREQGGVTALGGKGNCIDSGLFSAPCLTIKDDGYADGDYYFLRKK